jgi:hypothetical protein
MPPNHTEKLTALTDFRIDIKALDALGTISHAAIRINKEETNTLFSCLTSMRLGKVGTLELVSMSSESVFSIQHNPTIKHNVIYASLAADQGSANIHMSIRTLSLDHWVDRLAEASCCNEGSDSPEEKEKVYKSEGLPTITIGMYELML